MEKGSKCGHKNVLKHWRHCRVYKDFVLFHRSRKEFTQTIQKSFSQLVQIQQWNHDTSTPRRSETHGVAERAVRRVKEGTAIAQVLSGWNAFVKDMVKL